MQELNGRKSKVTSAIDKNAIMIQDEEGDLNSSFTDEPFAE